MRREFIGLTVVFLFVWTGLFPRLRGMAADADIFTFPLGYNDGQTYAPRIMYDSQGNLIENTDFDAQNPDLSEPSSCFGPPMQQLHHAGEDLYRNGQDPIEGTEVVAVANGMVIEYNPNSWYPGKAVVIEHTLSDGTHVYSVYMHLRDVQVQEGENVLRGQAIGYVEHQDYTGNYPEYHSPDDSHLHFEIRYFADANQVYLEHGYSQCAIGDKAGRGYTPPDVHADEWGYTDPTDFILAHQLPTPTPSFTPTSTPMFTTTATPYPTPPPDLTPGPGEYVAQCTFALSVSEGQEALHWCGQASTLNRAAFLSWSGTYERPQAFAGAVFRVLRSGPEVGIFNAYDLAYEMYDPGPDGGSGTWGDTVEISDAHWGMGAEGNNVPGPLIWLVSRCNGNTCGSAQVSGVLYFIAPNATPTPTLPPTPTLTPMPTSTALPTPTSQPCPLTWLKSQDDRMPELEMYYRLRDFLARSPQGQRYITLYNVHSADLLKLLADDPILRAEAVNVLNLWSPQLQAFLDAKGTEVVISVDQVQVLKAFAEHLAEVADGELQSAVQEEIARMPWDALPGATMNQAWSIVTGQEVDLAPTPGK